ncbi:MAG: hypothetical protein ACHQ1H_05200 [Nitrososphaerales archaeon]
MGSGFNPNVQSSGSNVFAAWTDKSNGIIFRASSNGGQTWGPAIEVGAGGQYPIMSVSGNFVYMVWSSGGIMFASSSDSGATWSTPIKLTSSGGITPYIASNGKLVAVVYLSDAKTGASYVLSSSDSGVSWTKPFQFSNGPEPQIAISGSNLYAIADDINKAHVQFAVSHDSGKSWKVSSLGPGSEPWIVASGSNVYATWETKGHNSVVWFLSSVDNGNTLATKIISSNIPDAWNPMINAVGKTVWVGIQAFGAKTENWILTSLDGGATWSSKSPTGLGHTNGFIFSIATSDGTNIFAMWLQKQTGSTWSVEVAYSPDAGNTWSVGNIGQSDPNSDVAIGSLSSNGASGYAAWQQSSGIFFAFS